MKRRSFCGTAGMAMVGLAAGSTVLGNAAKSNAQNKKPKYKFEIEIFEARKDTWCHKKGEKFAYPEDMGKICPWLMGSMRDFLVALNYGAVLPWKYANTPYEKVINVKKVTTEFVRCPDPTANLVAKITRTQV
ncbi:MAG: hypothetical protein QNJ97_26155 [Myxococcota bacterium]|nr:hypothetical protein [Myxococcota bacterium]